MTDEEKRRFGRRVFCVLIVLFMGVIWQSDLLSQEPAEVRSLRKQEILQTDDNYREYYFGLLTEDEKKIYREMLSGIQERQDEFYLTSSNEQLISKVYHALLKDHPNFSGCIIVRKYIRLRIKELIIADFHLDIRIQIRKFRKLWHSWNMRWKK